MDLKKSFEEFLIRNGYTQYTQLGLPSTVYDYIKRIDFVCEEETLLSWVQLASNIGKFVCMYDIGGRKEDIGNKSHRAVINALKRFRDFLYEIDYKDESYSKIETNFNQTTNSDNISMELKSIPRYVGVGSMVTYRILEEDEINQVTIVEPGNKKSDNEVSKTSELGESLLYCKEGDEIKVNSIEPYTIRVLHVTNRIKNVRFMGLKKEKQDILSYAKLNNNYCNQIIEKTNQYKTNINTNAEEQREIFWSLFNQILDEKGNPFRICNIKDGKLQSWACVNKYHVWNVNAIDLSFLYSKGLFRVDLYMQNGELDKIGRRIKSNKEDIDSMVTNQIQWQNGERNSNTLRPSVYFSFVKNDKDDYRRVIEKSFSTILEFIEIANKYGKDEFFDF